MSAGHSFGSGPSDGRRPWYTVFVTGRADLIPAGPWMYTPILEDVIHRIEAYPLVSYLDAVLWRKRQTHRVTIFCRDSTAAVDHVVRAYAKIRLGSFMLATGERDVFSDEADYRRDLLMLSRSHAMVWYGPREDPAERGGFPDPVTIAALLGIEYRVVPLSEPDEPQHDSPEREDSACRTFSNPSQSRLSQGTLFS